MPNTLGGYLERNPPFSKPLIVGVKEDCDITVIEGCDITVREGCDITGSGDNKRYCHGAQHSLLLLSA